MSFRELRNFTEMMRSLGYVVRPISVENFRTPNFELVADLLFWMAKKYDPHMSISDEIDTEDDRIEFLTSICTGLLSKARIKLNPKKLYAADGYAVKELIKIAKVLYDASRVDPSVLDNEEDEDTSPSSLLSSKLKDTKATRMLATEITEKGAKVYDLLEAELKIKEARSKAIQFLDTVSSNLESTKEHKYLEKCIRDVIATVTTNVASMDKQLGDLAADEKALTAKITKKKADLERGEKRLKSLQTVRPAFMDEYEKLEKDLEQQYSVYCERFRNLDYLEYELELHHRKEKQTMKNNDRSMQRMQKKLREEELRILRGEQDHNLEFSIEDTTSDSKHGASMRKSKQQRPQSPSSSVSSSDISASSGSDQSSSDQVSLGDSDEDSGLIDNDDDQSSMASDDSSMASSGTESDQDF